MAPWLLPIMSLFLCLSSDPLVVLHDQVAYPTMCYALGVRGNLKAGSNHGYGGIRTVASTHSVGSVGSTHSAGGGGSSAASGIKLAPLRPSSSISHLPSIAVGGSSNSAASSPILSSSPLSARMNHEEGLAALPRDAQSPLFTQRTVSYGSDLGDLDQGASEPY